MVCSKCGNELKKGDLFCTKCGKKVEQGVKENKTEEALKSNVKQELKKWKIIIPIIIILIIIVIVGVVIFNNLLNKESIKNSQEVTNNETLREKVIRTYSLNKVGLLKGENITNEEYNQNNDLISYKYLDNNNVEQEIKLNYEYDNLNRVTKISTETGPYVTINYIGEENKIASIDNYFPGLLMRYSFGYYDNEYPKILKLSDFPNGNGSLNFSGCILFEEKELNGKKYILTVETDENDKIISKKINLKEDMNSKKIFDILEIAPLEYWEGESVNTEGNLRSIILDNIIDLDFGKIISHGKEVYSKEDEGEGKNIYDNRNRILLIEQANGIKHFYKYTEINDNEYEYSNFLYTENEENWLITNWTEEEIEKYGGVEQKYRVYKDENGNVTKIETISDEEKIKKEDINKKLQEYQEYVDNNKVDTSSLNFDNLKNQLEEMKNNGGIQYSLTYNPLIDNKSEELNSNASSSNNTDSQTSKDSISSSYKEEEVLSKEDIESEDERIAKQEMDNASINFYIEYTKNGEGFYRSKLYDLSSDSDIQQVNELVSTNNEFLNFILYCHYTNYTVTIKETGKTYNSENIPRAIPFVEGKNTIVVELTDKYGHSRKISNTINVKKVGQIK